MAATDARTGGTHASATAPLRSAVAFCSQPAIYCPHHDQPSGRSLMAQIHSFITHPLLLSSDKRRRLALLLIYYWPCNCSLPARPCSRPVLYMCAAELDVLEAQRALAQHHINIDIEALEDATVTRARRAVATSSAELVLASAQGLPVRAAGLGQRADGLLAGQLCRRLIGDNEQSD